MDTTRGSLLMRLKNREDSAAWEVFDEIYRPLLLRFARSRGLDHADAEDITQQCMTAMHAHIGSFDYDPERGRFRSWLRTLVNNKVRNLLRDRRELQVESGHFRALPAQDDSPDAVFESLWMQQHLWHCLRELRNEVEESTYQAFQYYVIEQWPMERVCRELGMKANHVYTIKWRLTEKISAKMRELLPEEE
ncbi:MAG: sigma-70 family RNA polymerase sigma factor [Planctomycetota bacterium]|nr:sigma-70 family RNA polymerase sigma factor [Planctomycetota bacterium]